MGDSVAVIDPATDTIVGEIPVRGRPVGPAVGEGFVWVGNRDDNTLLRIDPRSLDVHTIGLGVTPTDVEVGAGSVWILSDRALLRVDPGSNDVVDTIPLPRAGGSGRWSQMEVGAKTVFVCNCHGGREAVIRIDPATTSVEAVRRRAAQMIVYGEGALWALTRSLATIEQIDPDERSIATIPARTNRRDQWLALPHGNRRGAIWVLAPASLWKIDSTTKRFVGSVPLEHSEEGSSILTGAGAVWVVTSEGTVLHVDPDSQAVAKPIPLGTLIYPAHPSDTLAVGEGAVWVAVTSFAS